MGGDEEKRKLVMLRLRVRIMSPMSLVIYRSQETDIAVMFEKSAMHASHQAIGATLDKQLEATRTHTGNS